MKVKIALIFFFCDNIFISLLKEAAPTKFKHTPRVALDFALPSSDFRALKVSKPNIQNIQNGYIVMFDGFHAGLAVIAITAAIDIGKRFDFHNPFRARYWTTVYRWALRYIDLVPKWLAQATGHYTDTYKVWRRRYYYNHIYTPRWMRRFLKFLLKIKYEDWEAEKIDDARVNRYASAAFGRHFKYPTKVFDYFPHNTTIGGTIEDLDSYSNLSIHTTINTFVG